MDSSLQVGAPEIYDSTHELQEAEPKDDGFSFSPRIQSGLPSNIVASATRTQANAGVYVTDGPLVKCRIAAHRGYAPWKVERELPRDLAKRREAELTGLVADGQGVARAVTEKKGRGKAKWPLTGSKARVGKERRYRGGMSIVALFRPGKPPDQQVASFVSRKSPGVAPRGS